MILSPAVLFCPLWFRLKLLSPTLLALASLLIRATARAQAQLVPVINTLAFAGDNGFATTAELNYPRSVTVDAPGNLYIADRGNNRKVNASTSVL
jgi:hypothetical protein